MMEKTIQVYMTERLYDELSFYAISEKKTLSEFCREILAEHVLNYEEDNYRELLIDD